MTQSIRDKKGAKWQRKGYQPLCLFIRKTTVKPLNFKVMRNFNIHVDKYHNGSSTTLRPIRQETQKERNFSLKTITRTGDFSFRVVRQKFQIIDDLQLL